MREVFQYEKKPNILFIFRSALRMDRVLTVFD